MRVAVCGDMNPDMVRSEVERIIQKSEVMAVARELRSGHAPRIGEVIDYHIEVPGSAGLASSYGYRGTSAKPYRVAVEPWHLNAARQMLVSGNPQSAGFGSFRRA